MIWTYCVPLCTATAMYWSIYRLTLADRVDPEWNRVLLLMGFVALPLVPLIPIPAVGLASEIRQTLATVEVISTWENRNELLPGIGLLWGLGFGVRLLISGVRWQTVYKWTQRPTSFYRDGVRVIYTGGKLPTATIFGTILWDESLALSAEERSWVWQHERYHARAGHSWDVVLTDFWKCVLWFNPFGYLLGRELRVVHELAADRSALQPGRVSNYLQLLRRLQVQPSGTPFFHGIGSKQLMRRARAMVRNVPQKSHRPRLILGVLGLCVALGSGIERPIFSSVSDLHTHEVGEQPPQAVNLAEVVQRVKFPEQSSVASDGGRVVVRVNIDPAGKYLRHEPIISDHPVLLEAVSSVLPDLRFLPARRDGKAVASWVNIPFQFQPA